MSNKLLAIFIAAGLLIVSRPLFAHHGKSNYDMEHTVTVKGVVTAFDWTNPHCLIHFNVTDEKGAVEKWIGETNSPNTLSRQGWDRNTVKPEDKVTIIGHRVKSGVNFIFFDKIVFANGRELVPTRAN